MLSLSRRQRRHEDIVADHYSALRRSALALTRGDAAEADDLLHDCFVRFLMLRPDIERIERIDAYLFTILRNVHLSARRRRAQRRAVVGEAADFDLLMEMTASPDPGDRGALRTDLIRLVEHASSRARVSRAANAWILRCVHGYYPAEIAELLRIPVRSVDVALSVARREAAELLARPKRPWLSRFTGGGRSHLSISEPVDPIDALRLRVFSSVDGSCLTQDQLAELYGDDSTGPVFTGVLAHIVACSSCLDRINAHLGLAPLAGRDPTETTATRRRRRSNDEPRDGSGEGGAGGGAAGRAVRRATEALESIASHVPKELRVTANGLDLSAQPVTGPMTLQDLSVRISEALSFVEIFDERGSLLCYWPALVPNDGAMDAEAAIQLPEGGRFDLRVALGDDCPRLHMRYTDPRVERAGDRLAIAEHSDPGRNLSEASVHRPRTSWHWRLVSATVGVLIVLFMATVGPEASWAALERVGRAVVEAVRSFVAPRPSAPPVRPSESLPATPPPVTPPLDSRAGQPAIRTPAAVPSVLSATELAQLEMDARVTLHTLVADLGEDVSISVAPAGVTVSGVVATPGRKRALADAFAEQRGVTVRVRSIEDVRTSTSSGRRLGQSTDRSTGAAAAEPVRIPSPASPALEATLASQFPDPIARATYVNSLLEHADGALARAWALRRLQERYGAEDGTALSARSRQSLLMIVRDHAAEMRSVVDALVARLDVLQPDLPPPADSTATAPVERVFRFTQTSHEALHALLAGNGGAGTPDLGTVFARLRRVQADLAAPEFGTEIFVRR